ncbi:MAG: ATPase domain-containing protein [Thermoplasmata archaeon]
MKRIVIDSITAVGLYYKSMEELRQEMFRFVRFLKESKVTAVLITESITQSGDTTRYGIEQFVADSFIVLSYEKKQGEFRRAVSVLKMRLTKHDSGTHPFLITNTGIEVSSEIEL